MRLILQYSESDGCTYHFTENFPVVYESAEALLCLIEERTKEYIKLLPKLSYAERCDKVEVHLNDKHSINLSWFIYDGEYVEPTIMTIDEYFKDIE